MILKFFCLSGSGSEDFAGKGDNKGSKKGTNGKGKKGKSKGKDPTGEDQEAEPPSDEGIIIHLKAF